MDKVKLVSKALEFCVDSVYLGEVAPPQHLEVLQDGAACAKLHAAVLDLHVLLEPHHLGDIHPRGDVRTRGHALEEQPHRPIGYLIRLFRNWLRIGLKLN